MMRWGIFMLFLFMFPATLAWGGLKEATENSMSGIRANRLRMELIASNIANAQTTRTESGGPYRRKLAIFKEVSPFEQSLKKFRGVPTDAAIRLVKIVSDPRVGEVIYQPGHPDADADGFVEMPNVSVAQEMADMVWVTNLYNANVQALNASRRMGASVLRLLQ